MLRRGSSGRPSLGPRPWASPEAPTPPTRPGPDLTRTYRPDPFFPKMRILASRMCFGVPMRADRRALTSFVPSHIGYSLIFLSCIFRGERCAIGALTCWLLGDNVGFLVGGVLVACTTRRVSGSWLARFGWIPASCSDVQPCYPLHCWHNLHWPSVGFLCFVPTRWNSVVNL